MIGAGTPSGCSSDGGVPKRPLPWAQVRAEGIEGDRQEDCRYHGGPDRAVCLYSLDLIEALQGEIDAAIVLVSHDVRVVARLCDRVGMLYAGRLLEEGPVEEVLRAPRHP